MDFVPMDVAEVVGSVSAVAATGPMLLHRQGEKPELRKGLFAGAGIAPDESSLGADTFTHEESDDADASNDEAAYYSHSEGISEDVSEEAGEEE